MALNDRSAPTIRHRAALSGQAVAIILLLPLVLRTAQGWLCRIGSRRLGDYGPGQFAWAVSQLARGGSLYRDFRKPPYLPLPYNPAAFYLAALISKAFGSSVMSALEAGCVETVAATATVGVFIFLLSRRRGVGIGSALIAVFAFLLARLLESWGVVFRCDMPALACDIAGVYMFSAGYEAWSVAAFVAAFFTRQSEIAGIAAVCLFGWLGGRRRTAARMALIWAGAIAGGILLLHLLVPYYLLNTFSALSPIYDFRAPFEFLERTLRGDFAIPVLAGTLLVARGSQCGLPAFFLLTTLVQAMLTSVRWGSDANYFIPPLAAASVLAAEEIEILFGWAP